MQTSLPQPSPKVLLVSEHASAKFGGEAALALHYYRVLRARDIPVWLVVHERTRAELAALFPEDVDKRIVFVPDTAMHLLLWRIGRRLPARLANFSLGFIMRMLTQIAQRREIRRLIRDVGINIVHQPMPVSPKEPSLIFGLGVPIIIGPMNGGMDYPPAFRQMQGLAEQIPLWAGRKVSSLLNRLIPGKRRAKLLIVANERTESALPASVKSTPVRLLVENGVDLNLWNLDTTSNDRKLSNQVPQFVFVGRLVDWKAVNLLIEAFNKASKLAPMSLTIIGDGAERRALEAQAGRLQLISDHSATGKIKFTGWLSQAECAQQLKASDAMVLPSLMECGGAVVLEAMAMGMPVIATNWGGPADYLNESCGILVNPDSAPAFIDGLSEGMVRLATHPELRVQMGQAGRKRVVDEFDWEVKVDEMLAIYHDLIAR